jgi:hypothetical protein
MSRNYKPSLPAGRFHNPEKALKEILDNVIIFEYFG